MNLQSGRKSKHRQVPNNDVEYLQVGYLSYRRETALQGGLVVVKSGRLEQGGNILQTSQVHL